MNVRLIYAATGMDTSAPVIFLVGEDGERAESLAAAVKQAKLRCALAVVPVSDWNRQLSPWRAPAAFRGSVDFGDGAEEFLAEMLDEVPRVRMEAGGGRVCLMGYSLAGLFALYAAGKTDAFEQIAALSPSVWFEGFVEHMRAHPPANPAARFYLSLGRKEEKAGGALLRTVGDRLREAREILAAQTGAEIPLVMHDGGHYTEVERRMLAAIRWICEE